MTLYANSPVVNKTTKTLCDLRSDTVTRPNSGMRAAMATAEVGDDVYGEDPSTTRLEKTLAERLGKEDGVFFPSGTQSNLSALMVHCGRGDEALVGDYYHIYRDEAAGASVLAGIALTSVSNRNDGSLSSDQVLAAIKPDDPHYPRTTLLCLENTVAGKAIPLAHMQDVTKTARESGLAVHLDGARFFNATIALDCSAQELAACADTISVCLSKGLGAPVGSVLVGPSELMSKARRHRKILGGAMRQSGVLAAAGLYALEHHTTDLLHDHRRAEILAKALEEIPAGAVSQASNMVFFTPLPSQHQPLIRFLAARGIRVGSQSPTFRMVLHRDISDKALAAAISAFRDFFSSSTISDQGGA